MKFYVFVLVLYMLSCYFGGEEVFVLFYKLGFDVWEKVKKCVVEKVCDVVVELLDIYVKC